jgi:hypothetical protein
VSSRSGLDEAELRIEVVLVAGMPRIGTDGFRSLLDQLVLASLGQARGAAGNDVPGY